MVKKRISSISDIEQVASNQIAYIGACKTGNWAKKDEQGKVIPYKMQSYEAQRSMDIGLNHFREKIKLKESDQLTLLQIAEYMQESMRAHKQITHETAGRDVWKIRKETSMTNYLRRQDWTTSERVHFYNKLEEINPEEAVMDRPFEVKVSVESINLNDWKAKSLIEKIQTCYADIQFSVFYPNMLNGCFKKDEEDNKDLPEVDVEGGFDFMKFYAQLVTLNYDIAIFEPHLKMETGSEGKLEIITNMGIEAAVACKKEDPNVNIIVYFENVLDSQSEIELSFHGIEWYYDEIEMVTRIATIAENMYIEQGRVPPNLKSCVEKRKNEVVFDVLHKGVTHAQAVELCYLARMHGNKELVSVLDPTLRVMDEIIFSDGSPITVQKYVNNVDHKIQIDGKTVVGHALDRGMYHIAKIISGN